MLAPAPPADVAYDLVTLFGSVLGTLVGVLLTILIHRARERRKGSTDVRTITRRLDEKVFGRRPSRYEPHPPPGLADQVETLAAGYQEHTRLLGEIAEKITPNGGNTREAGDLLLLIARKLDIDIPSKVIGDEHHGA